MQILDNVLFVSAEHSYRCFVQERPHHYGMEPHERSQV